MAGVALDGLDRHFAWQAWHLQAWHSSTHGSSLCVAGVGTYGTGLALVARLVPRPRWDAAAFCVAGVALCGTGVGSGGVLGSQAALGRRGVLRGRRGTL